jgi:uncharacterized protein (TIGR03083 family)
VNGPDLFLARLGEATEEFASSVSRLDPSAAVTTCPGWTVTSLVEHVVEIHRWVCAILTDGSAHRTEAASAPVADAAGLSSWYRDEAAAMQGLMASTDPTARCWNFAGVDETAAFWPRRQTHEVTVHTFDALSSADEEFGIDVAIAADGIDELLTVFGVRMPARGLPADLGAPIVIEPSDTDVAWTVSPAANIGEPVVVAAGRASSAVATIGGRASDILLVLWKRLPVDRVSIGGDRAVAAAFLGSPLSP